MTRRSGVLPRRSLRRRQVAIAYKTLPHYRVSFFESLRDRLDQDEVDLRVVYGNPTSRDASRRDTATLPWAEFVPNRILSLGGQELIWQPCFGRLKTADLVIVEQASRLLLNYGLLARQSLGGGRVAFWGHGANLQRHRAHAVAEIVKRRISRWPHWWFAYTVGSGDRVAELGYPRSRITVVQNAIDTRALRAARAAAGSEGVRHARLRLQLGEGPVAAFVGGLYEDKRLAFLIEAADEIVRRRQDFRLLIIGDGPLRQVVQAAAETRPYLKYLGPLFGQDKVNALATASALLLPGLVGLAILDAFALELPLVTTAVDFHSPEIEYLRNGENGVILDDPADVPGYAAGVLRVIGDGAFAGTLKEGCRRAADTYTNEQMVERFAQGVHAALRAPGTPS